MSFCTSSGRHHPSSAACAETIFAQTGQYLLRGSPNSWGFLHMAQGLVFHFFPCEVLSLFARDGISASFWVFVLLFSAVICALVFSAATISGSGSFSMASYFLRSSCSSLSRISGGGSILGPVSIGGGGGFFFSSSALALAAAIAAACALACSMVMTFGAAGIMRIFY